VLVLAAMLVTPSAAMAAKKARHTPKPDLKIVALDVNFGEPAFAIVGTDGVMEPVQVRVLIKNQGDAAAKPSTMNVFFRDSAHKFFEKKVKVPRLGPHTHPHTEILDFTGATPKLGLAQFGAVANSDDKLKESDPNNNFFKGEHFAIIARQWNVPFFETIVTTPAAATRTTATGDGFHFEFSHYDHSAETYVYLPMGSATGTTTYAGACSGTASMTETHNPWAGSLLIAGDFHSYDALVHTVPPTMYPITVSCIGITTTTTSAFDELTTTTNSTGSPSTNEQATKVSGDFSDTSLHTEFKWQFQAAIP
jgi:hypothetical protein